MGFLSEIKRDVFDIIIRACRETRKHWLIFFVLFPLFTVAGTLLLHPADIRISDKFADAKQTNRPCYNFMKKVSKYGNFIGVSAVCLALFTAGKCLGRRRLVLAGLAGILGASAAGLFDNLIRASTGRPRPATRIEHGEKDYFRGPSFDSHFQSFPSAHSATAFGAAAGIGLACFPLAAPAFAAAMLIAFSRLYLLSHYPTDVFAGSLIGIWFGLAFSISARNMLLPPFHLKEAGGETVTQSG